MAKELNILWVINIILPEAGQALGLPLTVVGGWLSAYRASLRQYYPQLHLTIVSPYAGRELHSIDVNGDRHYLFPEHSSSDQRRQWFRQITDEVRPDVVHIHGSEYPHSLDFLSVSDAQRSVLSIQGLVSVCAQYYYGGISFGQRLAHTTLRDLLRREWFAQNRRHFAANGAKEQELIRRVGNVIGRTDWDRAHCRALQPGVRYFHCEEALRDTFYGPRWQRNHCFEHPTLFVSQANYPIKGMHKLLEALPQVLKQHPDLEVHIAGDNLLAAPSYKRTSYGQLLRATALRLGVADRLHFLGRLSGAEMMKEYLGARIFVSPSIIENSSNSVCEAQLLGTPVIASNVGGMADLVTHRHTGMLYRFEETTMLADYILELLNDDDLCCRLSEAEHATATARHDHESIAHRLMEIYSTIAQ